MNFTLSGVSADTLRLAREDKATVKGVEVRLGHVEFDANWQLAGTSRGSGAASPTRRGSRTDTAPARVRSVVLMVGSADTRRSDPRFTYLTDASQRLRSPDDAFCDHVAMISDGVTRRFGPR